MRPSAILAIASAVAVIGFGGSARAQTATVTAGVATEYVFRGVAQTDGRPQAYGAVEVSQGALYAGVWASNVDYGDGTDAEVDLYGGARRALGPLSVDAGVVAYLYPGQPGGADYDYVEARLAVAHVRGPVTAAVSVFWTPDYGGQAEEGLYGEAAVTWQATPRWSVGAAAGLQTLAGAATDYAHWNVGLGYALTPSLGVDLRYHDTDANLGEAYGPRWVLGLKATF